MATRKLPEEINAHKEEWVALTSKDELVGHGKTPELCIQDAAKNGYPQKVIILLWVPDEWPGIPNLVKR